MKTYYVYFLASQKNGTLYLGVTNDLCRRMFEHKNGVLKGFSSKYKIFRLVFFEEYQDIFLAIAREKQLKNWKRKWKIKLIEKNNQGWVDLYKLYC